MNGGQQFKKTEDWGLGIQDRRIEVAISTGVKGSERKCTRG